MRISVVGTGYVGLVAGGCLADTGNDVICVDIDEKKISALKEGIMPILPGLDRIIERYIQAMGGRAAIEKLTTRVCSGQLTDDFPSRTPPVYETAAIEAFAKVPDKYLRHDIPHKIK